jgi:hypothetical protein
MESPEKTRPTRQVLLQRVRNRIIEYLEVAASFEVQRKYQDHAPNVSVPNEVINQWEDWVSPTWEAELVEPVFTSDEGGGIKEFYAAWNKAIQQTPNPLPALEVLSQIPAWEALRNAAEKLGETFNRRGKLSEEVEDA